MMFVISNFLNLQYKVKWIHTSNVANCTYEKDALFLHSWSTIAQIEDGYLPQLVVLGLHQKSEEIHRLKIYLAKDVK